MNSVNREGREKEKKKYTGMKETKERSDCSDWRKAESIYVSINVTLKRVRITILTVEKQ
jgi:hypothetical protein